MMSYAEEDPLEDEAEVEGEVDIEPTGDTEEEEEEVKSKASPDADTTLLFVKPVVTGSSQLGEIFTFTLPSGSNLRVSSKAIVLDQSCLLFSLLI